MPMNEDNTANETMIGDDQFFLWKRLTVWRSFHGNAPTPEGPSCDISPYYSYEEDDGGIHEECITKGRNWPGSGWEIAKFKEGFHDMEFAGQSVKFVVRCDDSIDNLIIF